MVESGGLENRCTRKGTVGSNPTLSAITQGKREKIKGKSQRPKTASLFPFAFLLLPCFWRGAGVAELAALEMLCTGNCTVGSNPTLSAITQGKGKR